MSTQIDPRGPRLAAIVTSVVLALVLVIPPGPVAATLLALQTLLFALGAARGVQHTPVAWLFKRFVRPRLTPPDHLEDPQPPRFAQGVGLAFGIVALAGYLSGATLLGAIATGFALAAALLNAVFGFCLGCEIYLLLRRLYDRRTTEESSTTRVNNSNTKKEVTA
jgi:nitrate/nitrite transporter NarK